MVVNGKTILSLIDRVTPYIKKGVKSTEHPNRIHFKSSEIPKDCFGELPPEIAEDATVAPFAQRLIHPNLYGMEPAVNKTIALVRNTRKTLGNIKDEEIKTHFNNLYEKILTDSNNVDNLSGQVAELAQKVELIENPEVKNDILLSIRVLTKRPKKDFKKYFTLTMRGVEQYTDVINILNDKYISINNSERKFYQWMNKNNIWLADIIDGTKKTPETYRNGVFKNRKDTKSYESYERLYEKYSKKDIAKTYQNALKNDLLEEFLADNSSVFKKRAERIYHQEYLKTLDPDIAEMCKKIQKEYGTYVIPTNADTTIQDLKYLEEEFKLWKETGKDKANLPTVLSINTLNPLLRKSNCAGIANIYNDSIVVRTLLESDGNYKSSGSTLRHEINHINDPYEVESLSEFEKLQKFVTWLKVKYFYKNYMMNELEKAGLSNKEHRLYAFTEGAEARSVSAEANGEELSDRYKDIMENSLKMQRWIFDIPQNSIRRNARIKSFERK